MKQNRIFVNAEYNFNIKKGINILDRSVIDDMLVDAICVTTNGIVKRNGELVMGAGVAKQFKNSIPNIDKVLGDKVNKYGNNVYIAGTYNGEHRQKFGDDYEYGRTATVLSFPTKHNYSDKSDLELIIRSAKRLVKWANQTGAKTILVPSPGTGLGGLDYNVVYNELDKIFDKRFTIVTK